jgi:hypothetical protein
VSQASRHLCLALLLGLLVGHASLAVHTATHASADSAHCDLCNSYGNASEALPDTDDVELPHRIESHPAIDAIGRIVERSVRSTRQRGPPVSN